ncbi:MAG: serine/threonine-protein kinase [Kiritimatiellia bacterium]|jgi:serine/threonine protein kinase|nr:serine/threonine-protein kinase [Kiritimatiellia bacterium]MDP6809386.1 serine/threonine-protein kinase [Kiritimatiellia bacterium]MDP7023937.1 serine/threonine-protein kinase [Kiritimatiellia bacterium]
MKQDSENNESSENKTVRIQVPPQAVGGAESSSASGPGSLRSQYDIVGRIGSGGMGVVYLARDRHLGRFVAIKRLNAASLTTSAMKDRFMHEARAVASLNHIHIVHIYTLGEDHEGPYIVMEYVGGPKEADTPNGPPPALTLADRVRRDGPLPLDAALELLIKLCGAIEYAHTSHVIHRDLKPTNVLLDESGEPKIADFGLARMRKRDTKPLTLPGEQMLSLGYGAPEQESDASQTDERADVYGLGALLYFCITGENPRYFRPHDLPEVLRMPIVKALETDREQRWADVTEFHAALAQTRAPSDTKLSTAKTTWRCKWCDTINPIAIRYCGKCGWDGGTFCSECRSESRFGVLYCGVCGADAKAYENAEHVLRAMTEHMQRRDFALVEQEGNHIKGFSPQGANGRELLDDLRRLLDQATEARKRREFLRNEIKREFDSGGYNQAAAYIEEYNALAFDDAFAEVESELEPLQYERDLKAVRTAVRDREWLYARNLAQTLQASHPTPEAKQLCTRITRRLRVRRSIHVAGILLVLFFVYLLSGAPAYRFCRRPAAGLFHTLYRPLSWTRDATLLQAPLDTYARLFEAETMFTR